MRAFRVLVSILIVYLFYGYIIKFVLVLTVIIIIVQIMIKANSTEKTMSGHSINRQENSTIDENTIVPIKLSVEDITEAIPSIFVNNNILTICNIPVHKEYIFDKAYKIGDSIYCSEYDSPGVNYGEYNSLNDEFVAFELEEVLEKSKFNFNLDNEYISSPDLSEYSEYEENSDEELDLLLQKVESGYLINSTVFLLDHQWHTTVEHDDDILHCVACDVYFEPHSWDSHVATYDHIDKLDTYKPLASYDMSIIRKIYDNLHCGVCNVVFPYYDEFRHLNSVHKGNLITAINRANDIMQTDSYKNLTSVNNGHYDSSTVSNFYNGNKDTISEIKKLPYINDSRVLRIGDDCNVRYDVSTDVNFDLRVTQTDVDVRVAISNEMTPKKRGKKFVHVNISEQNKFDGLIIDDSPEKNNQESNIVYENCDIGFLEENVQVLIKKSQFVITKYSYNTIVFVAERKLCFVCMKFVYDEEIPQHVESVSHLNNLSRHCYLDSHSKHLIRQNSDIYHCGVCNVTFNHDHLTKHLEWAKHKDLSIKCKTKKHLHNTTKTYSVATRRVEKSNYPVKFKLFIHASVVATPPVDNVEREPTDTQTIDDIKAVVYGMNLCVGFYNWHGIVKCNGGYRCIICRMTLTDVVKHCGDCHSEGILNEFLGEYSPQIIRKINNTSAHCVACNKEIFNDLNIIMEHINVRKHKKNHDKLFKG